MTMIMMMDAMMLILALYFCLAVPSSGWAMKLPPHAKESHSMSGSSIRRREVLASAFGISTAVLLNGDFVSYAFDNKISSKYDDRPKRRGPKPKDLGLQIRKNIEGEDYVGLKQCMGNGAPNCFVSDLSQEDDPDHYIPAWVWPEELGSDKARAFGQLAEVLGAYPPGQSGVDGGGFKIINNDPVKGYIYVQFESMKNGYIDDVELAFIEGKGRERSVQVRSSSRIGYLDFGVNAKRLNFLAKNLRSKGWDAQGVDLG